jgi:arylamine N-acetyltransferase
VQLNSAFSVLLNTLGYDVTWHGAGVQATAASPAADASFAPHLALSVELEGQQWLVDVGLGDGLLEPLPLRTGKYEQGPFTFRVLPSEVETGGWRFEHDPRGSIAAIDLQASAAGQDVFEKWHPYLCTSADSRLVRALTVMRRDQDSTDSMTGCMLRHFDAGGKTVRELNTADEWFQVLAEVFNLRLADLDAGERGALWAKVRGAHEVWLLAKAKRAS